ncbi:MAG: hypothetical protein OFPI_37880 [Osedax symbiont Rs2]|nr:MAG: hypothetical protein OFPI_37880 [Osedax symbiont Rs2]
MSINIEQPDLDLDTDIFNAFVSHIEDENQQRKKHKAKRLFAARRAIEKHRERRELAQHIENNCYY